MHHSDQIAHPAMGLNRVSERLSGIDGIVIPSPLPLPDQDPGIDEVGDDHLYRPLGDPDLPGNFAQRRIWIGNQTQQHVRVVRQKRPLGGTVAGRRAL